MAKSEQEIFNDLNNYINKSLPFSSWYVGIAKNARERLFNDHNVNEKYGTWIYSECANDTISRELEKIFLNKGCKGGDGGGDSSSIYIYAYKITNSTIE